MAKREPKAAVAELVVMDKRVPDGFLGPAGGITEATALEYLTMYFDTLDGIVDPEVAAKFMAEQQPRYKLAINRTGALIAYIEQCEAWIAINKEAARKLEERNRKLFGRVEDIKRRIGRAARELDIVLVELPERKLRIQDYPTAVVENQELLPPEYCTYRVKIAGENWKVLEAVIGMLSEKVDREPKLSKIVAEHKRLQAEADEMFPGEDNAERRRLHVIAGVPGARPDPNPRLVIT